MAEKYQTNNEKVYEDIYLARQPVFDQGMDVFAYELFYRDRKLARNAVFRDEMDATIRVLAGLPLCLDFSENRNDIIINFSSKAIYEQIYLAYPSEFLIIQLTDEFLDNDIIGSVKYLKELGYRFSVDNFDDEPEKDILFQTADFITIDFRNKAAEKIDFLANQCHKKFPGSSLIAKKIEDYDMYLTAKNLGFNYFQGYFFRQPKVYSGKKISSTTASKLRILRHLQREDIEFEELSKILSINVSIVHRLLTYINSPSFGLREKVNSVEQALIIMGLEPLKKWLQVTLLSDVSPKDTPHELILLSAQRAYFLELLSKNYNQREITNSLFLVGLFSLIDLILRYPKQELLPKLSLDEELTRALTGKQSKYNPWLKIVESCEDQDWETLEKTADTLGFDTKGLSLIYEKAYSKALSFF